MFLIRSMLTQLPWFWLENHCSRSIVVRSAVSEARHWSALIRSAYCTELHPGFPIPEPLHFCFAQFLHCESLTCCKTLP
jgi:hypothetical protein